MIEKPYRTLANTECQQVNIKSVFFRNVVFKIPTLFLVTVSLTVDLWLVSFDVSPWINFRQNKICTLYKFSWRLLFYQTCTTVHNIHFAVDIVVHTVPIEEVITAVKRSVEDPKESFVILHKNWSSAHPLCGRFCGVYKIQLVHELKPRVHYAGCLFSE